MVRVKDIPGLMLIAEQNLFNLKKVIEEMDEKRGGIFLAWLETQNKYLQWELTFDPMKNKSYKRGEVVLIHFGFNTGSEHGGPHWGVIIDDNKQSNPNAIVVPLGSLDDDENEDDLHPDCVVLGKITSINNNRIYAIPNQK